METKILTNLFQQNGIHDVLPKIQEYVDYYNIDYILDNLDILLNCFLSDITKLNKLDKRKIYIILNKIKNNKDNYDNILHYLNNSNEEYYVYRIDRREYVSIKKLKFLLKQNISQKNDLRNALKNILTPQIIQSIIKLINSIE